LHTAVFFISLLWTLSGVLRGAAKGPRLDIKAAKIRLPFELCSQLTRAAALGFIIVDAVRNGGQWLNVLMIGCAFFVGLLRLANDLRWRHLALHQVNFLLTGAFFLLFASELLPLLAVHSDHHPTAMVLGAFSSVAAALLVALLTPREWLPPSMELTSSQRPPESEPAAEETCSWFNLYLTFEWLTPLVWKGCRRQVTMDELPSLPRYYQPLLHLSRILGARDRGKTTLRTTFIFLRKEIILMAIWSALTYSIEMVAPFAMYELLAYLAAPDAARYRPGLWQFLMFAGPMARSVTFQQYIFTSTRLIVRLKSAMTQELYVRAMSSMEMEEDVLNNPNTTGATQAQKSTAAGRLANLSTSLAVQIPPFHLTSRSLADVLGDTAVAVLPVSIPLGVSVTKANFNQWPATSMRSSRLETSS